MSATQTQLARELGLSQRTISRAIAGTGPVNPLTRRRVIEAAAELGYRPNAAARSARTGRFGAIGLVMSTDYGRSRLPHLFLEGLHEALHAHDLHLVLTRLPDDTLVRQGYLPKFLREHMCDGLLINYTDHIPAQLLDRLRDEQTPSVWFNARQDADCVYPDDEHGGRIATEALIQAGHRTVAFVDCSHGRLDSDAHYSGTAREAGYADAMIDVGLEPRVLRPDRMLPGSERVEFAEQWLGRDDRPTAVVCYSARNAVPVIIAANRLGLRPPRDLSIVAIDDYTDETAGLKLATAIVPQQAMGRAAIKQLLKKIDRPGDPLDPVAVPFTFDAGRTCVPPPQTS